MASQHSYTAHPYSDTNTTRSSRDWYNPTLEQTIAAAAAMAHKVQYKRTFEEQMATSAAMPFSIQTTRRSAQERGEREQQERREVKAREE
jgi:hypothetical protein